MSTDLHIAVLTVGLILIAAAVVVSLLRMAGRQPVLAGAGPRLLMALAGVALILWALLATHPGSPPASARVTTGAAAAPGVGAAPGAVGAPGVGAAPAPAPTQGTSPAPAVAQPGQPDLIVLAGTEFDGCTPPARPADPPDGATATRAQMLASHAQTQAFDTATNGYLACLSQAAKDFERQYGAVLNARGLSQVEAMHSRIHNAAVDTDQAVADRFNRQLRIYKARGGAS